MRKSKFFRVLTFTITLVFILSMVACGTQQTAPSESTSTKSTTEKKNEPAEKKTFAVVFPIVHPFFEPVGVAAEDFGKENGWEVIVKAPTRFDVQQQIEIMENLIAMKVDGIGIGATDPTALVPYIDKAVDAGIKVIAFETDTPDSKRMAYIGTDNYLAGKHLAHALARVLDNEGKVLMLTGLPTQLSLNQRIDGIKDVLAEKYPNIRLVDFQSSQGDPNKAVSITEDMIQTHPDFDAFVGIDATAGPAAVSVWKAKGWKGDEKKIVTFDNMPENLEGIRDGYITSVITQMQHTWGTKILTSLNDLVEGKEIKEYDDTGSVEITSENIDFYQDEPVYKEE